MERISCHVTLTWYENIWISANRGSANTCMSEKRKKTDTYDFPEHDCAQDKMMAHIFLSSFDNGRLCEERLLRSINFAAMVM